MNDDQTPKKSASRSATKRTVTNPLPDMVTDVGPDAVAPAAKPAPRRARGKKGVAPVVPNPPDGAEDLAPSATEAAPPDPFAPDVWAPAEPPSGEPEPPADAVAVEAPAVSRNTRVARVGLFVGREWSFPPEFIKAVERRDAGVVAEYAKIGAPRADDPCPYDLCVDRISHEVPVYRSYLKQVSLRGAAVVNDPFMWTADDKFFGTALAERLGVATPKTVVLPNRSYVPGIVPSESLRNLEYPLDWQGIVEHVGLPCVLKDAHGGGWKEVYVCRTLEELIENYNESGLLTMIVQEFIEWEHFVRCLVIGREHVLPMKYDPKARKYIVEHEHMSPELGARVVGDARKLVDALGYDMNSIEFAVRGGVPYAIDFMNPAPDMDIYSLTPDYFGWAVEKMADMAVSLATAARDGRVPPRGAVWAMLGRGGR